ncbi:putative Phage_X domain-containing protein [Gammaproteobacteria bacterium]
MILIDWLSVYQEFEPNLYPNLGSEMKTTVCMLTGEIKAEQSTGYKHLGSFDSVILVKFHNNVLSVSGNPSHYNKIDNLYGCDSVQAGLEIYNKILVFLGYPVFYDFEDLKQIMKQPYAKTESYYRSGLKITRVDLTTNYACPVSPVEMLKYLSTNNYRGQAGYLYPNGRTVEWLGARSGDTSKASKHLYFKYYDKAFDIQIKLNKLFAKRKRLYAQIELIKPEILLDEIENNSVEYKTLNNDAIVNLDEQISYLSKLLQFTVENNVVRFELELKSKKLIELGLSHAYKWNKDIMLKLVDLYTPHLKQKTQFNKKIDLFAQLIDAGITERKARQAALIGHMWLDGHDVHYQRNILIKNLVFMWLELFY